LAGFSNIAHSTPNANLATLGLGAEFYRYYEHHIDIKHLFLSHFPELTAYFDAVFVFLLILALAIITVSAILLSVKSLLSLGPFYLYHRPHLVKPSITFFFLLLPQFSLP
jgi:hypothetical protein